MKFNRSLNEAGQQQVPQNQIDVGDLNNPQLKNILNRIEQTKKRHAKEIEGLMKQLEQVKAKNNTGSKPQQGGVPGM